MQKLLKKWFGEHTRLDADAEAVNAVVSAEKVDRRKDEESGATAIEYGLIAALIAVAIITGVSALGDNAGSTFNTVAAQMV